MKEKIIFGMSVLFFIALTGAPALYAEGDDSLISEEGEGPTLSEGTGSSAPEVGSPSPAGVVVDQTEENDADPSAFEGDSDSTPGERAPENMPMDDAPVDGGIGIQ